MATAYCQHAFQREISMLFQKSEHPKVLIFYYFAELPQGILTFFMSKQWLLSGLSEEFTHSYCSNMKTYCSSLEELANVRSILCAILQSPNNIYSYRTFYCVSQGTPLTTNPANSTFNANLECFKTAKNHSCSHCL